jgi:hypothetical protein
MNVADASTSELHPTVLELAWSSALESVAAQQGLVIRTGIRAAGRLSMFNTQRIIIIFAGIFVFEPACT